MPIQKYVMFYFMVLNSLTIICADQILEKDYFTTQLITSGVITRKAEISYYIDKKKVGFVSYIKIPLCKYYIIYSFYIYPQYRHKGYGKKLFEYACNQLSSVGASRIYIQPGPFEIVNDCIENINDASRTEKLQKLIKLYKKFGFAFVNTSKSLFVSIIYKIIGIDENPKYLMVKSRFRK